MLKAIRPEGFDEGVMAERARMIVYLRARRVNASHFVNLDALADDIERGAHELMPEANLPTTILSPEERYVVFAALCTMIDDVHSVQDMMSEEQWSVAERLHKRITATVDMDSAHAGRSGEE